MKKQIMASILVGVMAIGMAVPSFAAKDTRSVYMSDAGDTLRSQSSSTSSMLTSKAYTGGTSMYELTADAIIRTESGTRVDGPYRSGSGKSVQATMNNKSTFVSMSTTAYGRYMRSSQLWDVKSSIVL